MWPMVIPAFDAAALFATPDCHVLIRRVIGAREAGTRYDQFDRRGQHVGLVRLLDNERVVGAGRMHVYTVVVDADGLESLRRYRWQPR